MLNPAALEALYSATYLEDYLDCVESLPIDLQRCCSQLREIDTVHQGVLREVEKLSGSFKRMTTLRQNTEKRQCVSQLRRALLKGNELGDEKLQIVSQMLDLIETRSQQLKTEVDNIENRSHNNSSRTNTPVLDDSEVSIKVASTVKRSRRSKEPVAPVPDRCISSEKRKRKKSSSVPNGATKKKDDKSKSPDFDDIDPEEPRYCLCNHVSYGEMIACDNDSCTIEWFHFDCVGLTNKPRGKWYCPKCRDEMKRSATARRK